MGLPAGTVRARGDDGRGAWASGHRRLLAADAVSRSCLRPSLQRSRRRAIRRAKHPRPSPALPHPCGLGRREFCPGQDRLVRSQARRDRRQSLPKALCGRADRKSVLRCQQGREWRQHRRSTSRRSRQLHGGQRLQGRDRQACYRAPTVRTPALLPGWRRTRPLARGAQKAVRRGAARSRQVVQAQIIIDSYVPFMFY